MAKKYHFFTNDEALIFAAKINIRANSIKAYKEALTRTDIDDKERKWLNKEIERLTKDIQEIKSEYK